MPMQVLISFIQTYGLGQPLAVCDLPNGTSEYVRVHADGRTILGATGLCVTSGGHAALLQHPDDRTGLAMFDHKLEQQSYHFLERVRDGHDVKQVDGRLLVASTGTNRLIALVPSQTGFEEFDEHMLRLERFDLLHFNSVCMAGGRLLGSLFTLGEQSSDGIDWYAVRSGAVIDLRSGERLADNLKHPHTLAVDGDEVTWIESSTSDLCALNLSTRALRRQSLGIDGFVRGAARIGDELVIGVSADRKARKTGSGYHIQPSGRTCRVIRLGKDHSVSREISVHHLGSEIYDILPVHQAVSSRCRVPNSAQARIALLESRLLQTQNVTDALTQFLDRLFASAVAAVSEGQELVDRLSDEILAGRAIAPEELQTAQRHWYSRLGTHTLVPERLLLDLVNGVNDGRAFSDRFAKYTYALGLYYLNTLASYTQAATQFGIAYYIFLAAGDRNGFDQGLRDDLLPQAAFHRLLALLYDEQEGEARAALTALSRLLTSPDADRFAGRAAIQKHLDDRLAAYRTPALAPLLDRALGGEEPRGPG